MGSRYGRSTYYLLEPSIRLSAHRWCRPYQRKPNSGTLGQFESPNGWDRNRLSRYIYSFGIVRVEPACYRGARTYCLQCKPSVVNIRSLGANCFVPPTFGDRVITKRMNRRDFSHWLSRDGINRIRTTGQPVLRVKERFPLREARKRLVPCPRLH